ncbi:RNA polymerase sigma factor [Tundrisphaera sp. TA3]|uniref:RNA polymerase sigma factor n=1 Tax=Tundrisphaera sp. TA3 TaxID=3435775 RepID=UPI003EB875A2
MASGYSGDQLRHLGVLFGSGSVAGMSDAQLVERFISSRGDSAEMAFAALVARHGPMVLGVCRRILRDEQAAEDAFQATFLVLARRAGAIRVQDSLGRWLYGVSRRVAGRARSARGRTSFAVPDPDGPYSESPDAAEIAELRGVLDEEVGRLPVRLRESVILCLLEGLTLKEAASRMGCADGTAGSRLSRARDILRSRLTRRGYSPATCTLGLSGLQATTPLALIETTAALATGRLALAIPTAVSLLVQSTLKEMVMVKSLAAMLIAAGSLSVAGAILTSQAADSDTPVPVLRGKIDNSAPNAVALEKQIEPAANAADRERIRQLIESLRTLNIDRENIWGVAMRDLAAIGKPAVLPLIEELDRTTENRPLRALGFTLRAIGDPRAVPALIRAIPRTLVDEGSDYGLKTTNDKLLEFLQRHDLSKKDEGDEFSFGMPFREIMGALQAITGKRFGEDQLNHISLDGGELQRRLQRQLFHELALRWANWWETAWMDFTDDPAFSKVGLPTFAALPKAETPVGQLFPTGEKVRDSNAWVGVIIGPPQPLDHLVTFKDLDTGRESKWTDGLGDAKTTAAETVAAWAAKGGFDLEGAEYRPPGSDRAYFALRGIGLRAWQVDESGFGMMASGLRSGNMPDLSRPAGEYLMYRDPKTGLYNPEKEATFLFITREGLAGILQVTDQITELFRPEDFGKPVQEHTNRGFYRGVRFSYKMIYEQGK